MVRIFRIFVPGSVLVLLVSDAILLYTCYVIAVLLALDVDPFVFLRYDNGWTRIAITAGSVMCGLYFHDLYTDVRVRSKALLVQQVVVSLGLAFLVQASLMYFDSQDLFLATWVMVEGSAIALCAIPAWRVVYGSVAVRALGSQQVIFLGVSDLVREICAYWSEHPEIGRTAVGCLCDGGSQGAIEGVRCLGGIADLNAAVQRLRPDRIVVGMQERRNRLPVSQLLELRLAGIHVEDVAATYEATFGRISTCELRPAQLIFTAELGPNRKRVLLQSVYGTVMAAAIAIVTAPLMALIAIGIKLSSRGPVLFRQQRVGKHDVPFTLYKFRSMIQDAERPGGAVWAKNGDPRVTRFGRWLRQLRLDELPQLLNVLKGDMSIVGPRPERPEFVRELDQRIPYYRQRHCVRPGITGWAQINHKYGDSVEDAVRKLEYDLYYIKNLAPALDAIIMFHTAKVMLLSRGAQ
ncbi:MAG TPA: sugar transferase [Bryobacteraceae bacterium]|nr:sugar transferase [Bryobacteraceae bacterium]